MHHLRDSETAGEPGNASRLPLRQSLWIRVVAILAVLIGLTTAALFFGVDHFVSLRFSGLHDERVDRLVAQTRQTVERERTQMAAIASLLVNDIDLVNSTYYHLHLEGGREHPQAAVARIARAFNMESVTLWDTQGRFVAGAGASASLPLAFPTADPTQQAHAEAVWLDDTVWIAAVATIHHKENVLARIQIARPLTVFFGTVFAPGSDVVVRLAGTDPPPAGAVRVPVNPGAEPPVALDLSAPDTVAFALSDVKRVLAWVMTVFGIVLVAGLTLFLRRLLRPILELIEAALAVGRGEFGRKVSGGGSSEVAQLVTAFNEMSEGLRRLRDLERRVQHQEQLSAIGRVAARVAHDLNNPLTVISSVADLTARRKDIDEQLAADMRMILHHCERSMATIEALLAYGRPIRLRRQEVELVATCGEAARRWANRFPDVALTIRPEASAAPVIADPFQVERLLDNLLDNARAVGRKVGLEIGRDGPRASLRVTDDGPGFSEEAREHLFEPFFTTKTGGTGLGLASCLAIARAHGGDIEIRPGPPGMVTVWLPLAGKEAAQAPA